MTDETSIKERTPVVRFVTRQDGLNPSFVDGLVLSRDPQGLIVAHFYFDYLGVPQEATVFSDEDGTSSIETIPPEGIRNVRAVLLMTQATTAVVGEMLQDFAKNAGGESEEES